MHPCQYEGCTRWSDVDAYFDDGTSMDLCSGHAGNHWDDKKLIQVIPQHGSDRVNIEMTEDEQRHVFRL